MYIVFEGSNNVGKSTQLTRVKELLTDYFNEYPKSKPKINIFHEGDTCKKHYDNWYESVLDYARDRAHLQHQIKGSEYADITISDRSFYSSLVYQGKGDKDQMEYIRTVNRFAEEPDLVIFFRNMEDPDREYLYLNVIPYEQINFIDTDEYSIDETQYSISSLIFLNWLMTYDNMDGEMAYDVTVEIEEKIRRKNQIQNNKKPQKKSHK